MDVVDSETRSRLMAGIRSFDTTPELAVRRYLHAVGLRFKLGGHGLPGRPDLVFPGRRVAVFVHGCFWHRHTACRYATTPSTRPEFWAAKFEANMERDDRAISSLEALNWASMIIWECETRSQTQLDELAWRIIGAGR